MKIGIVTITNGENFGNRLQNYATQEYFNKNNIKTETFFTNYGYKNIEHLKLGLFVRRLRSFYRYAFKGDSNAGKLLRFMEFNKHIKWSKYILNNDRYDADVEKQYDFFVAGSDQIWNLNYPENNIIFFLGFINERAKKVSLAASFGSSSVPRTIDQRIPGWLCDIPSISVREESGKKIIKQLTGRSDVSVLLDPTMLLDESEWKKVEKKPKNFDEGKYILTYFLGEQSEARKKEILRIAKQKHYSIVNIMDPTDKYYAIGPSEFLYLERNASLICTDSFHSCVFSIIYNVPFVVFDREQKDIINMNSRIDTLIDTFHLKNRRYNGTNITKDNLQYSYKEAYKILENERKKSDAFLKGALDIKL